jgi:hypothetical protein
MPDPKSAPKSPIKPNINAAFHDDPGHYYIWTYESYYLGAADGGGHADDTAIQTDIPFKIAEEVGAFLQFTLWRDSSGNFAFQPYKFNFITAVNGGGRTSNALYTNATDITAFEQFQIAPVATKGLFTVSIQTANKNYLTAVGAGGKLTDAIHSDATTASTWEAFTIKKGGDLGSGLQYFIIPAPGGLPITAIGGGGLIQNTLGVYSVSGSAPLDWARFTLIYLPNGAHGVKTSAGFFLTAVNGGGLAFGSPTSDNIHTNATVASTWEQLKFIDRGDSTYSIQTFDGHYVGPHSSVTDAQGEYATNISDINLALKFWLVPAGFF